jgi:hypothetical protein
MMFKAGDTGRTRDGRGYEIDEIDAHPVWPIRVRVDGEHFRLRPDGRNYFGREDGLDLLPPTRSE